MKRRIVLIAVAALLLGGCGSIPLGTMWKMYRMGPEGLLNSNPGEVRAAVLSESWFLDGENFDTGRLEIEMTRADESVESFSFGLEEVSGSEHLQLDRAGPDQRWRVYAIENDQLAAFQSMQRQLSGWLESDEFEDGTMSVKVKFDGAMNGDSPSAGEDADQADIAVADSPKSVPEGGSDSRPDEVQFRIDLQLRQDEGYFTLIREYSMPISYVADEE